MTQPSGAVAVAPDGALSQSPAPEGGAARALAGRGSLYAAASGLQLAASMIAIPIATRLLSPAQYGVVALGLILLLLISGLAAAGLPVVLTRIFYDEDGPAQARGLFGLVAGLALLCCVVAEALGSLWLPVLGHVTDPLAIHIAVWSVFPAAITAMCEAYLRVAERARNFVILALLAGPGGQLLGILLVAVMPHGGPSEYMLGVAGGWSAAAVTGLALIRPWHEVGLVTRNLIRSSLAVGVPLIPHGIAWTLLALGDRTVIQRIDGSAPVGRYQVAYTVGALGLTLVTSIANAWSPIVFRASDERRWAVHGETLTTVQTVAALAAAILALLGPPLLIVATPGTYDEGALRGVVAFVAASTFPWVIYGSGTQVLLWSKRTASLAWITPVAALTNLVLVAVLLHPFGLSGAAAATLVAYGLLAALVWRKSRQVAPIREFTPAILIPWAAAAVLIALGALLPADGSWIVVRVVLCAGATGATLSRLSRLVSGDRSGARTVALRLITRVDAGRLATALLLLGLALVIALGLSRSFYPWGLGPSEATGWAPAELLAHLHNPYATGLPVTAPFVASAYGPAYYLVLGIGLRLFGQQFVVFRLISLLCTLLVSGGIGLIAYRFTGRRWAAALGAGLFLLQWPVGYWVSIQREDLLALAFAFAAFALVVKPRHLDATPELGRAFLAGIMATLSLLTRQTEILPLVFVLAWTLRSGGIRPAAAAAAGALILGVPVVTLLEVTSHGGFLTTLYTDQTGAATSLSNLRPVLQDMAEAPVTWATLVMLALVGNWLYRARPSGSCSPTGPAEGADCEKRRAISRRDLTLFLVAYVVLSGGIGLVSSAHLGSNVNYLLEPTAIAVLLVAVASGATPEINRSVVWRLAVGVLVLGALLDFARLGRGELHYWRAESYFNRLVTDLRRLTPADQPVTSVMPELASAAGRRNYFNDSTQYDGRVLSYQRLFAAVKASGSLSAIIQLNSSAPPGYHRVTVAAHLPTGVYLPLLYVRNSKRAK